MPLQYYHFSVDDVLNCLLEVSPVPSSMWEHPFFAFLKALWNNHRSPTDLYLFERQAVVADAPGLHTVSAELRSVLSSTPWLRFGPHALEPHTYPYAQDADSVGEFCTAIYQQIDRIAGAEARASWIRYHYFSECFEQAGLLSRFGVSTLLTTDKPAGCYRLPEACRQQLLERGATTFEQINFVRSHIRIENLLDYHGANLDEELDRMVGDAQCAVLFTHEYELARAEVRDMTMRVFQWVDRRGLRPQHPVGSAEGVPL